MRRQVPGWTKPMNGRLRLKRALVAAALAALAVVLAACGDEAGATRQDGELRDRLAKTEKQADVAAIYELQADFHRAATVKDLDLMMSRWAEDATLVVGERTYDGKEEIRAFVATQLPSFKPENRWVALTRSPKIKITTQGDGGRLYFECYYVDSSTNELKSLSSATTKVVRSGDQWLFQEFLAGPATLSE